MICAECGTNLAGSPNYCRRCGHRLLALPEQSPLVKSGIQVGAAGIDEGRSMNDKGPRALLVIKNVVCQQIPLNVNIGDLYITDDGITFVSYAEVSKISPTGYFAGSIADPLSPLSQGDKARVEGGMRAAALRREEAYGLTIAERRQQYKDSGSPR